jgi:hypothetical protein
VLQALVAQTVLRGQQDRAVIQDHKDPLDLPAHKEHLEQKATRVIQAHRVFQ